MLLYCAIGYLGPNSHLGKTSQGAVSSFNRFKCQSHWECTTPRADSPSARPLYNWNRYYDPRMGRYITSDPIGLKGGFNTLFLYVQQPLRCIDPTGEASCFFFETGGSRWPAWRNFGSGYPSSIRHNTDATRVAETTLLVRTILTSGQFPEAAGYGLGKVEVTGETCRPCQARTIRGGQTSNRIRVRFPLGQVRIPIPCARKVA
jgi:RHS repeat-associated protein